MRHNGNDDNSEERRGLLLPIIVGAATVIATMVLSVFTTEKGRELRRVVQDQSGDEPRTEAEPEPDVSSAWVGGWISPVLVTIFTLGWVFLIYTLIGTRTRTWQYGTVPYIPGQFAPTSYTSQTKMPPSQVIYAPKTRGVSR